MMREVLFRGKLNECNDFEDLEVVKLGDWVYGLVSFIGTYNYKKTATIIVIEDEFCEYQTDLKTLGQYTGLTDKNGKQIFEGDLLGIKSQLDLVGNKPPVEIFHCYYDCEQAGFYVKSLHTNSKYMLGAFLELTLNKLEVIGNIHDNPELLKGE